MVTMSSSKLITIKIIQIQSKVKPFTLQPYFVFTYQRSQTYLLASFNCI